MPWESLYYTWEILNWDNQKSSEKYGLIIAFSLLVAPGGVYEDAVNS